MINTYSKCFEPNFDAPYYIITVIPLKKEKCFSVFTFFLFLQARKKQKKCHQFGARNGSPIMKWRNGTEEKKR